MANKVNLEIKANYELYDDLLVNDKTTSERILLEGTNQKDWNSDSINVKHITVQKGIKLNIGKKISIYKYAINLRCKDFTEKPFFRFDSDGATHRNKTLNIPLNEQKITTPHFHKYIESGIEIAYKNDVLKKEKDATIIQNDIDFGLSLFYQEANINSGVAPKVEYPDEPLFEIKNNDPLNSLDFVI